MKRLILVSLALSFCGALSAQQSLPGRYFTPADLTAQMKQPNDQRGRLYLMGAYDRTQDVGQSCAVRGSTTPVLLAKLYSDYLTAHPELASADRSAASVASQALRQYWPCQAASPSAATESLPTLPADADSQFACPEALPSDQARTDELRAFLKMIIREAAGATLIDGMHFRREMLEKHGCLQTLQHLQAAAAAVRNGDYPSPTWYPVQLDGSSEITLATSGVDAKPVVDPRFPAEQAVDTDVKLTFTKLQQTNVTHVSYDSVISHNIYYCGTARFALVENDYFLSNKLALKDPSPVIKVGSSEVYEIEALIPGSMNAAALQPACRAIGVISVPVPKDLPGRYFTPDGLAAQPSGSKDQIAQNYLMGIYDLTQDAGQSCAQRGTTTPVLLEKVYSDYITAHPELMHADRNAAAIAARAFAQYWPCTI
jgi:hypothetical protein